MRYVIFYLFTLIIISGCSPQKANLEKPEYKLVQSKLGGGGYITGLLQNPQNPDIIYARSDVAGMYKSIDRGSSWTLINKGLSKGDYHQVESFAMDETNPDVLFRCSGIPKDSSLFGAIHRSIDGGDSWQLMTDQMGFYGNGENRMFGEMIQVSPTNPKLIAAFSFMDGVWISQDGGDTWKMTGLKGEPGRIVAFDPFEDGVIYAGTRSYMEFGSYFKNTDLDRPRVGRFYKSMDNGLSWKLLHESTEIEFLDIAFDFERPGTFFIASSNGLFKTADGGVSFDRSDNGLPKGFQHNSIFTNKNRPNYFYTAINKFDWIEEHNALPAVPIYYSEDSGESWHLVANYEEEDFAEYPEYIMSKEWLGWAVSTFIVDYESPDKMYMANWYGVSTSTNTGKTWKGNYFDGLETICGESISYNTTTESLFITLADHTAGFSLDDGQSYHFLPKPVLKDRMLSSTAVASNGETTLFGLADWPYVHKGSVLVMSDGDTSKVVRKFEQPQFVQAIRNDPFDANSFYVFIDGEVKKGAGLYRYSVSEDVLEPIPHSWIESQQTLPVKKVWVESELLPIVTNQVKNVCGANQLLAVHPSKQDVIAWGEWTEGVWLSLDKGDTWKDIRGNLPFGKHKATMLSDLDFDPSDPQIIYASFVHEGLWRTKNLGQSWEQIYPEDGSVFNASSLDLDGKGILAIACEPLFWSPVASSIYVSNDNGEKWRNIYDGQYGALRWKGIAIDRTTGSIHGITAGNGIFRASIVKK